MSYDSNLVITAQAEELRLCHNYSEVWKSTKDRYLLLLCFKEVIHPVTFIPEIVICDEEVYDWGFEDCKKMQRKAKSCPGGSFILLSYLNLNPVEIPHNFINFLKHKLMSKFVQTPLSRSCSKGNKTGNWCILLQKIQTPESRTPNDGFGTPRNYVLSDVFSKNKKWLALHDSIKKNLTLQKTDWDFNYENNGTWLYVGESFSSDTAEISINLKILPYAAAKQKC